MTEQADIMVVTPHPDDAESRMAGSVARWARDGKRIVYVVCTNGDKGTSDPNVNPADLAATREEEQLAAAEVLGVKAVEFLRHPDQSLEESGQFRKDIVRLIRQYKPDTVVTVDPYRGRLDHRDHRTTARVVMDAIYPFAVTPHSYPDLLEQGFQPHRVKEMLFCGTDNPDYFVDVTDTFDLKVTALQCHKSQIGDLPRFSGMMRERAETLAEGKGYDLAEGFYRIEVDWQLVSVLFN